MYKTIRKSRIEKKKIDQVSITQFLYLKVTCLIINHIFGQTRQTRFSLYG